MSLATRCNACGTVFRVVQDQLKVSEGWVRCGRCNEVFNALEGLYDLERDASPHWLPTVPDTGQFDSAPTPLAEPSLSNAFAEGGMDEVRDPALVDRIDEQLFGPRSADAHRRPMADLDDRDRLDFVDARLDSEPLADAPLDLDIGLGEPALAEPIVDEIGEPPPEFVQRADRAARWQRSGVRVALGLVGLLLLGGLALQLGHQQRNRLAVEYPELRPVLEAWCTTVGCRIEPLRRIEDIAVESSALTRSPGTADAFKLTVALRNRGGLPLALPSIDLSLTDAAGQLVARRALNPADFRVAGSTLGAGAEASLQLTLAAGDPRVSGYTVEIFYP